VKTQGLLPCSCPQGGGEDETKEGGATKWWSGSDVVWRLAGGLEREQCPGTAVAKLTGPFDARSCSAPLSN
jgi:hypothetical protein